MPTSKSKGHPEHRAMLREKGWSYRVGAKALGVNFTHLHRVLTGERQSQRLLAAIEALPVRKSTMPTTRSSSTLPRMPRKS